MELADILTAAINDSSRLINQTGQRWPDRPIVIEMSWHPQMGKLDLVLRTLDHLPPYWPKRHVATARGDSASE